ncbi:hypothetical protein GCM10011452_28160 [Gemmobacter lanyuensis]|uniref:Uncharacterized protein n=1 Tax=Gemmobacter lanyuensis TaxID=1054497 RepID=A0A918MLK6_9RHOB|nr:hypothetical protein [Gemmobacter lanyuensis]GGW38227.1 hypothetical protein GCM10011452_28160 [Gemmobacter lanyuensis]
MEEQETLPFVVKISEEACQRFLQGLGPAQSGTPGLPRGEHPVTGTDPIVFHIYLESYRGGVHNMVRIVSGYEVHSYEYLCDMASSDISHIGWVTFDRAAAEQFFETTDLEELDHLLRLATEDNISELFAEHFEPRQDLATLGF